MKTRRLTLALSALALAAASFAANADILFQNLGTAAPPATLGGHTMTQFDQSPQAAIPDGTSGIALIPGAPMGGTLGISAAASKFTVGNGWGTSETWGHGYLGPVFYSTSNPVTLTLPAGTKAFYFYTQSSWVGTWNITATTDSGTSSGPISVSSGFSAPTGANGFGFYSTAGESIISISVTSSTSPGLGFAEFGISDGTLATTCASEGYTGLKLDWCRNICEKDYTGTQLKLWIRRWMDRYHDLPYCMREDEETPPLEQGAF